MDSTVQASNKYSQYLPYVIGGVALSGAAYLAYRFWSGSQPTLSEAVESKLPLAKDLPTITDFEGNYDIDGVSYDVEGVIISSDNTTVPY